MKLPDFKNHALLNALRNAMDAPYLDVELTGEELRKWLDKDASETLGFSGMRVLIYIRDGKKGGILPAFHTYHCGALTNMINNNLFHRYVVTKRMDGKFLRHHYKWAGGYDVITVRLHLCGNCLRKFKNKIRDHKIYSGFDIKKFFAHYGKKPNSWRRLYPL